MGPKKFIITGGEISNYWISNHRQYTKHKVYSDINKKEVIWDNYKA